MELPVTLCQTATRSCMGCCGHSYAAKEVVQEAVQANTAQLDTCTDLAVFSKDAEVLRSCGVCRGVVKREGRVLCGLHPMQHKGVDHRDRVCEKEYLCKSMRYYQVWEPKTKQDFLDFIENANVDKDDWFTHSMNMDQDVYLEGFLAKKTNSEKQQPHDRKKVVLKGFR